MRDGDGLKLEVLVFACVISGEAAFSHTQTRGEGLMSRVP